MSAEAIEEDPQAAPAQVGRALLGWLVWLHRWTGVALCLVFAMWFASGAVMVFVPFPSLSGGERAARSQAFDPARLALSPAQALAAGGGGKLQRLVGIEGRPVYVVGKAPGASVAVGGDDGAILPQLRPQQVTAIAAQFGGARPKSMSRPLDYDQWIVGLGKSSPRPFYRVRLDDPVKTDLYVSAVTGEVGQKTTAGERGWNWVGSVVHWIYFTPLRKHPQAWTQVVYWLSLAGVATTAIGAVLAGIRSWQSLKKRGRWSPFRGWTMWHHIVGIVTAVFVFTWILSGWLSMDSGALFSDGSPSEAAAARYAGLSPDTAAQTISVEDLRRLAPAARIEFGAVGGRAFAVAEGGPAPAKRLVFAGEPAVQPRIATGLIAAAVRAAWPDRTIAPPAPVSPKDWYAQVEGVSETALHFAVAGKPRIDIYVDAASGRPPQVIDDSRRANAWLYYAFHTLKLPGLAERQALWWIVILSLLAAGFGFSVTGVVLAWRRLTASFAPR